MDRELSSKELVEKSNIENKELILERMKAESLREGRRIEAYEHTVYEQRHLLEAYRAVLQDIIHTNWMEG